jgi:hypothetical protein
MFRSDIPIPCLIRYKDVAVLQLSNFLCHDTTPLVGCLCDCPIYVTLIVTTYALVTFHIERVCTVQHAPLTDLPRKSQPRKVTLTLSCLEDFETLKLRLISAPCLILPEVSSDAMFTVATNASTV